jgi:hypothetical protein
MKRSQELIAKQRKHLWPNQILYYADPLPLDRGEGMYVWDVDGNKYLDFFAGILTTSVGHNNGRVRQRINEQLDKLIHSSTLYPNQAHIEYAEMLAQITPEGLDTFYFGASGTDADETAVLMAQVHTGNTEIIALRHGYSGKSQLAMTLTGQGAWRMGPVHIGYVRHAMTPYTYRALGGLDEKTFVQACLDDLQDVIKTMTSGKIAALIMEPIQGVGGFITLPPEYMEGAAEIARAHGGLVIIDEVQTGFGRTGTHWWGHQHSAVQTRHHDDGQGDRQRNAAFGRGHHAGNCPKRGWCGPDNQHLWRQSGRLRGGHRHAGGDAGELHPGPQRRHRPDAGGWAARTGQKIPAHRRGARARPDAGRGAGGRSPQQSRRAAARQRRHGSIA